jgi:pimeloyl-ACP methyl ester carboxylesterase
MGDDRATPVMLLVHGAWHGSWCWQPVVDRLSARGVEVRTIDLPSRGNPSGDLHGDARAVRAVVDSLGAPVVLVGHSYGGAVIGEASDGSADVSRLVFLAALVLDVGETAYSAGPVHPGTGRPVTPDTPQVMEVSEDAMVRCRPELAVELFYHDCEPDEAARAVSLLVPQPSATLTQPADRAGWKDIPSTYVLCRDDRILEPATQRRLAARCSGTVELATSHSPFLSAPDALAEVLVGCLGVASASPDPTAATSDQPSSGSPAATKADDGES